MSDELKILVIDDTRYETKHSSKFARRKPYVAPDPRLLLSQIPGQIIAITAHEGQRVRWGDDILVLEAMKMRNAITAPQDGVIKRIHVRTGDSVQKHQILVEFE